jgi:hypothetical protein
LNNLFVEDFDCIDDLATPAAVAPPPPERDVDAELATAYARGLADGCAQASAEAASAVEALLARCTSEFRRADEDIAAMAEEAATQLARLMFETLGALVPAICASCGPTELAELTRVLLPRLRNEPQIRVRLNPHDAPAVLAGIGNLADDLPDRIVVTQTDAVTQGDIRVAWQDGAMLRDTAAIWQDMSSTLQQFGFLGATPARDAASPSYARPERPHSEQVHEHAG